MNYKILIFLFVPFILINCKKESITNDTEDICKDIDGNIYETVEIGSQIWMAENLRTTRTPDGKPLLNDYCYSNDSDHCEVFGALYTYDDAIKASPVGWHLPTDEEWKIFEKFLGMDLEWVDSMVHAHTRSIHDTFALKLLPDGCSGFNILLAGFRYPTGTFSEEGKIAWFWTATLTENKRRAITRTLMEKQKGFGRVLQDTEFALSVRCIKNQE